MKKKKKNMLKQLKLKTKKLLNFPTVNHMTMITIKVLYCWLIVKESDSKKLKKVSVLSVQKMIG